MQFLFVIHNGASGGFVRRYVWHLRQKVEKDPENPQYIHNERGFGYRFGAEKEG